MTTEPQSIKLSLDKITALLSKLGNPQNSLKAIHVSGTNGKGSVCAYLTCSLVASGLKVGAFNSPHLIDRWDCITINNTVIPKQTFLEIEKSVQHAGADIGPSSFEVLTASALEYFKREKVDIAVIECGMGGLTDATNVFPTPLVSIITHISFDHTAYLGTTLESIAKHKAGIIKPACPVVTSAQSPDAEAVIQETAREKGATLHLATGYWRTPSQMRYMVENVRFQDVDPLATPILGVVPGIAGGHQGHNIASAVKALDILRSSGYHQITEEAVQKGIASASIPGRMEWIRFDLPEGRVPMLLDGAHNVASCGALAKSIADLRGKSPVVWVIGFSQGRAIGECMSKYIKHGDFIACVEFGDVDGMQWVKPVDSEMIKRPGDILTGQVENVKSFGKDVKGGIKWAVQQMKKKRGMLVGTGSLYLVGHIHRLIKDDPEFNGEEEEEEDI